MLGQHLYLPSADAGNVEELRQLQYRMANYYLNGAYHKDWIHGINSNWQPDSHAAQIAMCKLIPRSAAVLEVGCGAGDAAAEIKLRTHDVRYVGMDLNPSLWVDRDDARFVSASGTALPFGPGTFDVVLSMFVIEHLVFPARFLDEAWALLRPGGRLLVIAPDFWRVAMASERIGMSYGSGREKLKEGRLLDAILTAYDSRVRLRLLRWLRQRTVRQGQCLFPILTEPLCLQKPGFVPDCDAVYPSCPEELTNYLRFKPGHSRSTLFHRDSSTFGLLVEKS